MVPIPELNFKQHDPCDSGRNGSQTGMQLRGPPELGRGDRAEWAEGGLEENGQRGEGGWRLGGATSAWCQGSGRSAVPVAGMYRHQNRL